MVCELSSAANSNHGDLVLIREIDFVWSFQVKVSVGLIQVAIIR